MNFWRDCENTPTFALQTDTVHVLPNLTVFFEMEYIYIEK